MAENDTQNNRSSQSTLPNSDEQNDASPNDKPEVISLDRVPWSQLAQEFAETWGRADPKDPQPESAEVIGMNGSGKTLWMCKAVQERMLVRYTPVMIFQSKPDDATVVKLGWPIITDGNVQKAKKERWSIFWPQTNATGRARKAFQADKFRDMLNALWGKNANIIIVLDDVGYIQGLVCSDGEPLNPIIEMFLREGRSCGITMVLLKQRPQGAKREMHSETYWTIAFRPKDEDDIERFAQLFGDKKAWMPVIRSLNLDKHEFVIKSTRTGLAVISWVDTPLRPLARPKRDVKPKP